MANRNTLWASIFVDELARSGLAAVCAAPGSRHTPLMLAFAKHESIKVYSHLDERSASFFALGMALASNAPVALVCTSGTAGANMYPAIIEAHQSRVPLIVITADRPHELRHSGANQTIDQIKMFGNFVLWFVDAALPEAKPSALALRNLRTTANRAYATANGLRKGVVHINMPFRKPLEPTAVEGDVIEMPEDAVGRDPRPTSMFYQQNISHRYDSELSNILSNHAGIVICGRGNDMESLVPFAQRYGFPVFADSLSSFRFGDIGTSEIRTGSHETYLSALRDLPYEPEVVVRFGNIPLSKSLNAYLDRIRPKYYLLVAPDGEWNDDTHRVTHFIQEDAAAFADGMLLPGQGVSQENIRSVLELEKTTWYVIDHEIETGAYFDGAIVYDVVDLIPDQSILFAGNSLPVRHLDQFGKPQQKRIHTYANRGASGIDGNISTALGTGATHPGEPVVAIIGDITFYHDMNGLLAVQRCGVPITIVLLNNDGGGIFNRLPIRDHDPEFTDYFITPHGLDFSHAAALYGLEHVRIDVDDEGARYQFRQIFVERVGSGTSTIIEVCSNSQRDEARRQEIVKAVGAQLRELNL